MTPASMAARIRALDARIDDCRSQLRIAWLKNLSPRTIEALEESIKSAQREIWTLRNPQLARDRAFAR